ncbi:sensor histidine kinase [Jidongwangia harbinensis]|uniref:sensor histidine kinase n=1 Tax=Jidongwangia harbinensis TaxID=2878561 RepID=UPI001CDA52EB|nr:histidine kinase [Jidongwangia harbinensis]MCA2212297.1 histidine kinase [Jidongwangia harbinensis]
MTMLPGPRETAQRWWRAVRSAGPGRLTYEGVLAVAVAAVSVLVSWWLDDGSPAWIAASAAAILVLVPLRLVFPAGTLLAATALGAAEPTTNLLLVVLCFSAGYRIRGTVRTVAVFAVVLLAPLAADLGTTVDGGTGVWILALAGFLVANVLPAVVGRVVRQRRQLLDLLQERNVHLRNEQGAVADRARARERARIAGEMHDSLGHRLTLISMYAGALRSATDHPDATVEVLHQASVTAMAELRQILGVLRHDEDDGPAEASALDAVEDLVAGARSAGARIELTRTGAPVGLPPMVEHAAYRTLQEGVTNALRHARGSTIRMTVRYEPDALVAEVVNGPGAPAGTPTGGQGLYGLAERVHLTGGLLYHGREADGGYRLAATLPLDVRTPEPHLPPPDPADAMIDDLHRAARRRSRRWIAALALGSLAVVGLCFGGGVLLLRQQTVSAETFASLRVGDAEDRIRARLPEPSAPAPGSPAGTTCLDYSATPQTPLGATDAYYRLCFRDGVLITKEGVRR